MGGLKKVNERCPPSLSVSLIRLVLFAFSICFRCTNKMQKCVCVCVCAGSAHVLMWFKIYLPYAEEAFRAKPIQIHPLLRLIVARQRQQDKAHTF